MTRIGACANCGGDVLLVYFDALNGCRFCVGCGRRGPDAPLAAEATPVDEQTPVDFTSIEEVTRVVPAPELTALVRGAR